MLNSGHCRCGHGRQRTKKNCPVGELPREQRTRNSSRRAESESKEGLQLPGQRYHWPPWTSNCFVSPVLLFSKFPNSQMSYCEDPLLQSIEKDVVLSGGNLYHSGNLFSHRLLLHEKLCLAVKRRSKYHQVILTWSWMQSWIGFWVVHLGAVCSKYVKKSANGYLVKILQLRWLAIHQNPFPIFSWR